jgi:hypothetical protein
MQRAPLPQVVDNYRRMYKEKFAQDCPLTNDQIWAIREDNYFCDPGEGTVDDLIVADMREQSVATS